MHDKLRCDPITMMPYLRYECAHVKLIDMALTVQYEYVYSCIKVPDFRNNAMYVYSMYHTQYVRRQIYHIHISYKANNITMWI